MTNQNKLKEEFIKKYIKFCQNHFGMEVWPDKESYFNSLAYECWDKLVEQALSEARKEERERIKKELKDLYEKDCLIDEIDYENVLELLK